MAGQNRQRRSELQRHRLHRDVCALARAGLVLFREARPAEGRADAVIARSAEPARPRRECRASRRGPLPTPAVARTWRAGGSCLCWRGHAAQGLVDASGMCSFHRLVKEKTGRRPLSAIKLMKSDSEAIEAQREHIKARYRSIFGA